MVEKTKIHQHLSSSSVVGVTKMVTSQNWTGKVVWTVYLLMMIIALVLSLHRTLVDYYRYDKVVQRTTLEDEKTEFPDLTICSREPFSTRALDLWKNGEVTSPMQLSGGFRNAARKMWNGDTNITDPQKLLKLYFFDHIRNYFSQLKYNESVAVSHKWQDIIEWYEVWPYLTVVKPHYTSDKLTSLNVNLYTEPNFGNCYTISLTKQKVKRTKSITIAINLKSVLSINHPLLKNLFIFDRLRENGLRIVVHEHNTRPDILGKGLELSRNEKVDIVYHVTKHLRINTPNGPCKNASSADVTQDLERTFEYTRRDKIEQRLNEEIYKKCGCVDQFRIRPASNLSIPICHIFSLEKGTKQLKCINEVLKIEGNKKHQFLHRCVRYSYELHVSHSRVTSTPYKVKYLNAALNGFQAMMEHREGNSTGPLPKEMGEVVKVMDEVDVKEDGDDRVIITLRRVRNYELKVEEEKLLITLTGMISQIGGLLGIYLGMSCAVLVEIVDIVLQMACRDRKQHGQHLPVKQSTCTSTEL